MGEKMYYSDKPFWGRILLLIVGFVDFPLSLAVSYILKGNVKKDDEWKVEFLDRGAKFGLTIAIISLIIYVIATIFNISI